MKIRVQIEGERELREKLEQLQGRARAALLSAAQAGAMVIEGDADRRAPGPHVVVGNERLEGGRAEIEIGPDREHWYYRFFEFGATEHELRPSRRRALKFESDDEEQFSALARHPGMAARPFLRPAMDTQRDAAVTAVGRVFRAEVDRLTRGGG